MSPIVFFHAISDTALLAGSAWADENVEPQYLAQLIDDSFSMLCKQYCLRAEMT